MRTIKVAIVDDSEKMADLLEQILRSDDEIRVVGRSDNGLAAINMIRTCKPDIVLLDLIMPHLDGIEVLRRVKLERAIIRKPSFIVVSGIGQGMMQVQAMAEGVEYYIMKPFENERVIGAVKETYERMLATMDDGMRAGEMFLLRNLEKDVSDLMQSLGVPAHVVGYAYLKDAILLAVKDSERLSSVTKVIYPNVAKKYATTSQRVERSIRHAIATAWSTHEKEIRESVLGNAGKGKNGNPTNAQFIALLAERVRVNNQLSDGSFH